MKVSLFATCIVDQIHPQIGEAMVILFRRLGVAVTFNPAQTCCGQPAFNAGYRNEARQVAERCLEVLASELETSDYVVVPSGSCTAMIRKFYRELFADDPARQAIAERVAERVFELSEFIVRVLGIEDVGARFRGHVTYHDSCHLLRELGVSDPPRRLLKSIEGVELLELEGADVCCGFGGLFAVKHPEISTAIAMDKARNIESSEADTLVACDAGCLMQISGLIKRNGSTIRCLHLAEMLIRQET